MFWIFNKNENITSKLVDTANVVFRWKSLTLKQILKKKTQIYNLNFHLKHLVKEEQNKLKASWGKK